MKTESTHPACLLIFPVNLFILLLAGCQSTTEDTAPVEVKSDEEVSFSIDNIEDVESLLLELGEIFEEVTTPRAIDYQKLQKILPKKVNGVRPTIIDGSTFAIGSGFSQVQGEYEDGEQTVTVTIVDLAALGKLAAEALSDWLDEEIDRESDRGFERTLTFQNRDKEYPAYEKYTYERGHESCELHSWVEDRFLIAISGDGVSMSICRSAQDRISYRRLERLALLSEEE